jgi:hypothetical protein
MKALAGFPGQADLESKEGGPHVSVLNHSTGPFIPVHFPFHLLIRLLSEAERHI